MATNVDAYLSRVCARLRVNPAEADELREELRNHLEELIQAYCAGGIDRREATDLALAWFGDPRRLRDCLDLVHQGDAWWVSRLKGLALGMLVGGLLALAAPIGGHLEFIARLFAIPAGMDATRVSMLINALVVGGAIGLLSSGGRGILVGWSLGSLVWLAEYVVYWMVNIAREPRGGDASLDLLNSVLLAPLLGGVFGALVGLSTAAALSGLSRSRPEIH